ncbi:MAG: GntR family transcriptional regulator [Rhodobacteraceae bacterium]|nr:GntR family transcriptional regulator [Paracoccaceae bacterium]
MSEAAIIESGTVRRESLREQIYADLLRRLQLSEIGPDDRLIDTDIAAQWGASRMPAREALLQLVNEGYLRGTTRGFAVPVLSIQDIRDIFEVRRLLEPRAAACAARDLTEEAAIALDAALAEARAAAAASDARRMIAANIAFRGAWLACVRNERLAATIARFVDHVQTVRLETLRRPPTRAVVVDGLAGIHAAMRARDPITTADRMTAFMAAAEEAFFAARGAQIADEAAEAQRISSRGQG